MSVTTNRRKNLRLSAMYFVPFSAILSLSFVLFTHIYIVIPSILFFISYIFFCLFLGCIYDFLKDNSDFIYYFYEKNKTKSLVKWLRATNSKHHTSDIYIYFSNLCLSNERPKTLYWSILEYSDVIYDYLDNINRADSDDDATQDLIHEFEPQLMISYEKIVSLFNDPGIKNVLAKNEAAYLFDDVAKMLKNKIKQEIENLYPSVERIRDSRIEFDCIKNKALQEEEDLKKKIAEENQHERDQKTGVHVLQILDMISQEQD